MKRTLIIVALIFTSSLAFGECDTKTVKKDFFDTFKVEGGLSDWVGVGLRKGFKEDRLIPIFVTQAKNLEKSSIDFRGDKISLDGAKICTHPDIEGGFIVEHSNYDGTLSIERKGYTVKDSIIKLKKLGGILKTYIRPVAAVK